MTDTEKIAALRALLEQIEADLRNELAVGGLMPTVFPEDIRAELDRTA